MLSNNTALTVVVVAHNESGTLLATVERVYRALVITVEDFAIVIFDDGSSDGTQAIAESASQRLPFVTVRRNERRKGAGYCTVEASRDAESAYLVYVPADNTWPLRSFIELFGNLAKADVVTSYSNNLMAAMPAAKRLVSRSYSLILNTLFLRGIRYYNGLTIYPVDYLRQGSIRAHGFGFQAEALLKAVIAGYSFLEIALPVDAQNLPRARSITLPNIIDALLTICRLFVEFYVLRRRPSFRLHAVSLAPLSESADDIGIAELERGGAAESKAVDRAPLRIVIAGGSSGIGARLAQTLASEGHRIFVCARRADRLARVADNFPQIATFVCDVSDDGQVRNFVAALAAKTDAVDVLINCAGGFGEIGSITVADSRHWWHTIEVNLKGTYLVIQSILPLLTKGKQPRVINFAGGGAFSPFPNFSAYACSKTAIVRLTECLAAELAPLNIRVNALAPGFVPTDMHQATLKAGEARAGRMQFQRTQAIMNQAPPAMDNVVNCVRMLISPSLDELTGKTISSNFDPWPTPTFKTCLPDIVRSDLYTLRRVNVVNLPDGRLRTTLSQPWVDGLPGC
jgi:NAD(P)-dependent dehydrogenase (short-subunit alcohol dehydrogenase family)/glycosyltransferase involved in cell wall biosynthesis